MPAVFCLVKVLYAILNKIPRSFTTPTRRFVWFVFLRVITYSNDLVRNGDLARCPQSHVRVIWRITLLHVGPTVARSHLPTQQSSLTSSPHASHENIGNATLTVCYTHLAFTTFRYRGEGGGGELPGMGYIYVHDCTTRHKFLVWIDKRAITSRLPVLVTGLCACSCPAWGG